MRIETPQSTSIFRGWLFRMFMLVFSLAGFLGVAANTSHRLSVTSDGVPAEIAVASRAQAMPSAWLDDDGQAKAPFTVRIQAPAGPARVADLSLRREVVEALLRGETRQIVHEQGNPQRFLMAGDPPPPFGLGWLAFGIVFLAVFVLSLRLR
jgi:hypothetical protein